MTPPVLDVVVPVLWRPERLRPVAAAIAAATTVPYRLTFVADPDDLATREELLEAGLRFLIAPPSPPWERATWSSKANLAYRELEPPAPYLAIFGDDVKPHPEWAERVLAVFASDPEAGVVGTNDLCNPRVMAGRHATHPVISRAYVERHGGATADGADPLFSEAYRHAYTDGELVYVAKARGAFRPCLAAVVEHLHPQRGFSSDRVYELGRSYLLTDRATQKARLRAFDARTSS